MKVVSRPPAALPYEVRWLNLATLADVARAIRDMHVRGAPLIGATAAYGMALVAHLSIAHTSAHMLPELAAAKAALIGLSRSAARELGPLGIRVNVVAPGPVRSRMTDVLSPAQLADLLTATALGRVVDPGEVADVTYWLARATAVTGQTVIVDGGRVFG